MIKLSASELRRDLSRSISRVVYTKERIRVKRGRDAVAIVPLEDLELIEELENRLDLEAARKALKEPGSRPWEEIKAELGL